MKRFYTLLVLCLSVFSTLLAETYTQKVTVYAPATCTTTDIVFYGYKNKSDKSPYKTISGQPTSMYMNGLVLYKAEIPFNDVVYVKCTYKTNTGDENSDFSNEITQTCSRYCGLDGYFGVPSPSAWYNTFDEAKYNQELFDLNYKANEGTLYVVYDKGYHSTISVYSSEYGEQYKKDISANTVAEYSLLGNTLLAYTVADYEVYDRVIHNYESTFTIDWNKPFYYDGVWYAKLSDIPIKNLLKEWSCYRIVLADRITEMYHIGDNIYSCLYNGSSKGLYYFNKDSETKFECKTNCGAPLATMNVELKQYGYYTLEFTYNANTNKIECKSELQQADKYIIRAFDYSSIYNAPQMELVGENEYSFSLTTTRDKGLYYYNIDFVSYNGYTSERIKDKLIQITEAGTYDITITYNAETQATSCTVNKADPLAPIYLRGTVNNWGVDERYKLTTTDGNYYVATYTKGNEVEIGDVNGGTAEFKIGSVNSDYSPINFGGNKVIERGGSYRLTSKGVNLKVNGSLKVSKIEFWLSENKLTITPAVQEVKKIYYVNKWGWYNVDINVEPQGGISDYFSMNKESVTYQGYEVYSYEVPTYYSTVYFDGYGQYEYSYTATIALDFTKPYYYDGVWYETLTFDTESEGGDGEDEGGDDNGNDNTGGDDTGGDNTGGDDDGGEVTPPTPTVFDTTTDQGVAFVVNPNSANSVFVPLTYSYNAEFQTAQYTGTYTVTDLDFTAKIGGLTNLDVINFGTNGEVLTPNYVYMPTKGASEGFTIAGDYKVGDILKIFVTLSSDWYADVIINVIPTLAPTENDITLYYVNVNDWSTVYGYVWPTGGAGLLEWPGSPATKIDKTVDGYDVYSYTFDSTQADNIIFNNGGNGSQTADLAVVASKPYYYNGVWYETLTFDATGGDEGGSEGGDQGGDDTGDVEIGEPANLYIIGALTGWAADATWQFSTADDEYFVLSFPKGQEQELSGLFKVASSNWSPYNYGAPLDLGSVEAGKEYVLEYNVATNLSVANIIKVSKIEFTLSTQTLKITGATEEKVFDTTSDYGFYLYADYKDYRFTFKGNGVYEYDYTSEGPSSTIGDYQYKTVEWGRNSTGNKVTLGELYQLGLSNHPISFPDATKGQTLTIVLTVSSDWSATILVKEKSSEEGGDEGGNEGGDPIVPETHAYVVRGNGGSDATGIWCGGIEWTNSDSPVNNMTDTDKDGIYEVTYKNVPAGTWNFKVVGTTEGWMGSDFLDTKNSSAGCTTAPYDGNIGFTLNAPADVTIKFNTLTGKIIVTTPSGSFEKVVIEHFHILTGNNQCLDEFEFTEANNYTIVLTQEVLIDEEYGVAYVGCGILGNCDYAVYEKYFSIEVTENGTYTVTVQFNGDYENPDFTVTAVKQGGTIDPDPVVAIKNLMIQPFEQVLPNTTTTTVATFTLQNANTATVSIEGLDADFFEIGEQNIGNGECSVSIVFKPIVIGVYYATLVVTTDDEVSLSIDFAAAAGDETFEPGDVPELNPDPVNPSTPDDEVSVEEVSAIMIYAKEGTIYSEVEFEIYDLAGVNVTKLNGSLQGVYIVKTAEGNRLVSVW